MRPIVKRPITIKLTAMYIISKYPDKISDDILHDIAVGALEINYFFFRQALFEINQIGYIRIHLIDGKKYYSLTDKGAAALHSLADRLTLKLRAFLSDLIKSSVSKEQKTVSFSAVPVPADDVSWDVECKYKEGRDTVFTLAFKAGSLESAKKIANSLEKKGDRVYESIYGAILKLTKTSKKRR